MLSEGNEKKIKEIKQEGKSPVIPKKNSPSALDRRVFGSEFFFLFNFPKVGPYTNVVD